MRTGIESKAKSAEDLWLGFKKLCPAEIFLSFSFSFFFFLILLSSSVFFPYISKYTEFVIIKIGKNTVGKWNNGERENSLATCQVKKENAPL